MGYPLENRGVKFLTGKLVETVLKESIGIIGARELGINEAVTIPDTQIRIVYENVARYPILKRIKQFLPLGMGSDP